MDIYRAECAERVNDWANSPLVEESLDEREILLPESHFFLLWVTEISSTECHRIYSDVDR
jgi:hypothetical protein